MRNLMLSVFFVIGLLGTLSHAADAAKPAHIVEIKVTDAGFEPSSVEIPAGVPVTLKVTRTSENTCATEIKLKEKINGKKIEKDLPLNETVSIELGKVKKGKLAYACGMNMLKGELVAK